MKLQKQNSVVMEPEDLGMEIRLRIAIKVPMIICEDVAPVEEDMEGLEEGGRIISPPTSPKTMCLLTVPRVDSSVERRPCEFNNNVNA